MIEWIALHLPRKIRLKVVEQFITSASFLAGTKDMTLRDLENALRENRL